MIVGKSFDENPWERDAIVCDDCGAEMTEEISEDDNQPYFLLLSPPPSPSLGFWGATSKRLTSQ